MTPHRASARNPQASTGFRVALRALFGVQGARMPKITISATFALLAAFFAFTASAFAGTPPEKPLTGAVTANTGTSITFNGTLNPATLHEAPQAGSYEFRYKKVANGAGCEGESATAGIMSGLPTQPVTEATAVEPDTEYTVCLAATNTEPTPETTVGNPIPFKTKSLAPTVESESTSTITDDGATPAEARLEATVNANNEEVTKCKFEYGTSATLAAPTSTACEPATLEGLPYGQGVGLNLTGLAAKTTYYYRVLATNATGETKGTEVEPIKHFTTPLHPETPEPKPANPVAAFSATLNGVLNPNAAGDPGTYEFLYKQSATECEVTEAEINKATEEEKGSPQKLTPVTHSLGGKGEAASAAIAELLPHTAYTFCLLAKNEAGEVSTLSAPQTFTTLAFVPRIEAQWATKVSATGATLNATVNPEGAETTYTFEYAPAGSTEFKPVTEPGASGTLPEGTSGVPVSVRLQHGLAPGSTYEFRIVIENEKSKEAGKAVVGEPPVSFTTQQVGGEFVLPDGRQYEMVTPPAKQGALFKKPGLFFNQTESPLIEASPTGNAIVDQAAFASEANPQGDAGAVSVLSTRSAGGWSSRDLAPPHTEAAGAGIGYNGSEDLMFSEDLSHAVEQQFGAFAPLSPEAGEETPYIRTNYLNGNVSQFCSESCYQPLVTRANALAGVEFGKDPSGECNGTEICGPTFQVATPDFSHIVLRSEYQLTSMPVHVNEPEDFRYFLYEWSAGQLQPITVYPNGEGGGEGVLGEGQLGGEESFKSSAIYHTGAQRAISENGQRVIFTAAGVGTSIYLRDLSKRETLRLDLPEPECAECTGSIEPLYLTANSEDSRIFFLDEGRLTSNSGAVSSQGHPKLDLYECEIVEGAGGKLECKLHDLTPAGAGEEAGDATAVLGTSSDGSYVYFAAGGKLAPGAPSAPSGECNPPFGLEANTEGCDLYVRHDGVTRLVAPGWIAGDEAPGLARVSPDGRWLTFMSPRSLTGYDNRDANSGLPDNEVYLYHAPANLATESGTLVCASCNPTGARPVGDEPEGQGDGFGTAANLPAWTFSTEHLSLYQPRYLSDSGRLFFDSHDALVPKDVNGVEDVYEYEPAGVPAGEHACTSTSSSGSEVYEPARGEQPAGCVALISSGTSTEASEFLDASAGAGEGEHGEAGGEAGRDVFFITTAALAPQDLDAAADVYDAHECTTQSPCIAPPEQALACTTEASCKPPPTPQPSVYGPPSSATFSGPGDLTPPPPAVVKKVTKKTVTCKKGFVKKKVKKKEACVKKKSKKSKRAKKAGHGGRTRS
jgi:hypothetical protein